MKVMGRRLRGIEMTRKVEAVHGSFVHAALHEWHHSVSPVLHFF